MMLLLMCLTLLLLLLLLLPAQLLLLLLTNQLQVGQHLLVKSNLQEGQEADADEHQQIKNTDDTHRQELFSSVVAGNKPFAAGVLVRSPFNERART
jgi:hypothetical protein